MSRDEKKLIRNSTVEFLLFTSAAGEDSIEVRYEDETIWLSQKMKAALFDVTVPTVNYPALKCGASCFILPLLRQVHRLDGAFRTC